MVDILERLQSPQTSLGTVWPQPNLHEEAADEITRLREENARLREQNTELMLRAHALLWLLPPEITCGEVQKAKAALSATAIREGGKDD